MNSTLGPKGFAPITEELLQEIVNRMVEALHPEKIVLFGSWAYGTPTPDSDVDLLIVMETDASYVERYLAVSRLLRPRPFPVDIIVKTPEEISAALEGGDFFIREIITKGKVLYERDGG
ncbi:MAG: nucleotidyltransferase domain-containing protein [Chloroflexi bacterium]|nr:MAG: nucleotidyltransferase domain-containing protein [Chloroflexota bacterium]HDN78975.1 nucleotidyltransferase domain-containing protein [Chloroflexota bacterium]